MEKQFRTGLLATSILISLSACNNSTAPQKEEINKTGTTQTTPIGEPAKSETKAASADWITMGDYKFKLDPDIQKNGEAHLDFYAHDVSDAHVLGVKGTFHITMPDGTKKTLAIEEEKPYEHYHGKLMLEQFGEYQVVAQTTVKDQKFNPRFTFTRKQ